MGEYAGTTVSERITQLEFDLAHARQEVDALKTALRTYGQHRWKCHKLAAIVEVGAEGDHEAALRKSARLPCSCGLSRLLEEG